MTTINKIVLFEYDTPIDRDKLLNYKAGIWFWTIVNTYAGFTDDYSVTGYYEYQQSVFYNIKSLKVGGVSYSKVSSIADCDITDSSFYYDSSTTYLYIHFTDFGIPPADNIFFGAAVGYSKMPNNEDAPYFNDVEYKPLLTKVLGLNKSIDPLFFGLLKYSSGSMKLINAGGEFDNWRSRNLFGQPGRVMVGNVGSAYSTFDTVYEGFISDDNRTFDEFTVKLEDPRRALTQPVATNLLSTTLYPHLNSDNSGEAKPVAYGTIKNAPCYCLNEEETTPTYYTFLICDTEFNLVDSLDTIYVDGTATAITGAADLTAGTFTMTFASVTGNLDKITIDFTATDFDNGVSIIKDLMYRYDGKTFISSFWDVAEVNAAVSRSTSLYIDKGDTKLSDAIESVLFDIDGRFFVKNNGLYTIRIYDPLRAVNTKVIESDEWQNYPNIDNNGSEYLSSAIIEYSKNIDTDRYLLYENTDYQTEAFDTYKKLKAEKFTTNLTTLSDAMDKSETIMNISKQVQDIIKRSSSWDDFGIEPTDFIDCSPVTRLNVADDFNVYEVVEVKSNVDDFTIDLSLRYVRDAAARPVYASIDDNNDAGITDNNNQVLVGRVS